MDRRSLVVLAGLPGAGKSTALRKLGGDVSRVVVLDSEQVRAVLRVRLPDSLEYRYYRPLVHLLHRARILWYCVAARDPVLAHEPATRASTRLMLLLFAALSGRRAVLLWLHADAGEALAGQRARGRLIRSRSFRRHIARAGRMHVRLVGGAVPAGWSAVAVLTRRQVSDGLRLEVRG
ncbi:AAA family ATPase [Saccharopolyspora sp. CA-218241]|uniref:AAA family ATPase n=1 Tax=Saccharopolyspora sp. CA-218241 TaxID=3240027 RepID=UPI003D98AAF9